MTALAGSLFTLLALPSVGVVGRDTLSTAFAAGELRPVLLPGAACWQSPRPAAALAAGGLAGAVIGAARRAAGAVAGAVERGDGALREWPFAGLSLLVLAIAFGVTMVLGR